jgi:glycosyltransferase involved in cell wall biosynthesis
VSIIIPAYNTSAYLAEAIDSALVQTYPNVEVVVVDDGSTDDTPVIMGHYGSDIVAVRQPNSGLASARNAGVHAAAGSLLVFLDADDTIHAEKLRWQVAALSAGVDLGVVAGGLEYVTSTGQHIGWSEPWLSQPIIDLQSIATVGLTGVHGTLIRRSWFDRVGGFDVSLPFCEDLDLWWRLAAAGCTMQWTKRIVGRYRIHGENMSRSVLDHLQWRLDLLSRMLRDELAPRESRQACDRHAAWLNIMAAGRLCGAGDLVNASALISVAIEQDTSLAQDDYHRLIDAIGHWYDDPWLFGKEQLIRGRLPMLLSSVGEFRDIVRRTDRSRSMRLFYTSWLRGDYDSVIRAWARIAAIDPSWWVNRGAVSILARSAVRRMMGDGAVYRDLMLSTKNTR